MQETKCLLSSKCKVAGEGSRCNELCFAYLKFHGESGVGGIWGIADVPKAYATAMIESLPIKKDNPQAFAIVTNYCSKVLRNVEDGLGIYMFSVPSESNKLGTGTGKTTSACTILNEFIVARTIQHIKKERLITELPALFVNVSKFQNNFNAQFRGTKEMTEEASRRYYLYKERMMVVELLVLDDIGVREATESFKNEFFEVIDERVIEQKATILTSNVPLSDVAKLMDERIASRIEGATMKLKFQGEDKRRGGVL